MAADMATADRRLLPSGMSFVEGNVAQNWKQFQQKLAFYF